MAFSIFGNNKNGNQKVRNQVVDVAVAKIVPNQFQPRRVFDDDSISELAETISEHGLLQPIILREFEKGQYEIIAGERRYRAVSHLGWPTIPAIVQQMNDKETASLALIENLQREELTSIEEAQAYRDLMGLNHLTQAALAKAMGKGQATVANKLRLLKLIPPVQNAILDRHISERHGRALLSLDEEQQRHALMEIVNQKLTVAQTETLVDQMLGKVPMEEASPELPVATKRPAKKKQRPRGLTSDTRVAVNTIKKSVSMIRNNGMKVTTSEEELDDAYRIVIDIPKNNKGGKN